MKILVVEDDFASRMFLSNALSRFGTCDSASQGIEAVTAFQTAIENGEPYQLVFLDIMMPYLDGLGALKLMRQMEKSEKAKRFGKTWVVMTSALNDKQTLDNAFIAGCDAFLAKPIQIPLLLQEVEIAKGKYKPLSRKADIG